MPIHKRKVFCVSDRQLLYNTVPFSKSKHGICRQLRMCITLCTYCSKYVHIMFNGGNNILYTLSIKVVGLYIMFVFVLLYFKDINLDTWRFAMKRRSEVSLFTDLSASMSVCDFANVKTSRRK